MEIPSTVSPARVSGMHADHGTPLGAHAVSTLLYYDIFRYPLKASEVFAFLPVNSVTEERVRAELESLARLGTVFEQSGYYSVDTAVESAVERRRRMERYARRHWRAARLAMHVIKRCPFVRCVLVTGTLSKNISAPELDIDFFIVTAPGRLWIARTLLILFKKLFLFNSRKYFCLNYFVSEDALEIPDKNVFTATEIAHTKVLYNSSMHRRFLEANAWTRTFFPNLRPEHLPTVRASERRSLFARACELLFRGRAGDRIDDRLMRFWQGVWDRRYPELPPEKRDELFRVRKTCSKAHGPDFNTRIMRAYELRRAEFRLAHLTPSAPGHAAHTARA